MCVYLCARMCLCCTHAHLGICAHVCLCALMHAMIAYMSLCVCTHTSVCILCLCVHPSACPCVHVFYLCVCLLVCTYVCICDHWRDCSVAGIGGQECGQRAASFQQAQQGGMWERDIPTWVPGSCSGWQVAQCRWPRLPSKGPLSSKAGQASEAAGCCLLWEQTFSGRFSMCDPRWRGDF